MKPQNAIHLARLGRKAPALVDAPSPKAAQFDLHEHETQLILQALDDTGGNITHAAKKLGISRRTLHRKINELKLRQPPTHTTDPPPPHGL